MMSLIIFSATVAPMICTPGNDILFIGSQARSGGTTAELLSTAGICLGSLVHSALVTLTIIIAFSVSAVDSKGGFSDRPRRIVDGSADRFILAAVATWRWRGVAGEAMRRTFGAVVRELELCNGAL